MGSDTTWSIIGSACGCSPAPIAASLMAVSSTCGVITSGSPSAPDSSTGCTGKPRMRLNISLAASTSPLMAFRAIARTTAWKSLIDIADRRASRYSWIRLACGLPFPGFNRGNLYSPSDVASGESIVGVRTSPVTCDSSTTCVWGNSDTSDMLLFHNVSLSRQDRFSAT